MTNQQIIKKLKEFEKAGLLDEKSKEEIKKRIFWKIQLANHNKRELGSPKDMPDFYGF